ncbi:hypothetical protein VB735_18390, partial [Halotia wernerae UHCC 0503]|nr:hypothetical protein [Halotia wernerae UHCC 0503]
KQKAATPKSISLEDLIKSLAKPIQDMLSAGYDYSDVAEVFKGHGVELAASGIKSFYKKALTTNANQDSNESSVVEQSESSDSSATATSDDTPAVESSTSPTDTGEESSTPPKTTAKGRKATTKTNSQFNVTDRSEL